MTKPRAEELGPLKQVIDQLEQDSKRAVNIAANHGTVLYSKAQLVRRQIIHFRDMMEARILRIEKETQDAQ